jgi:transposase
MAEESPKPWEGTSVFPSQKKPPVKIGEVMPPASHILNEEVSMDTHDDSRLAGFRQLKREIRGSTAHLVVGIDIAKDRHHAFFGTPSGKTLSRLVFDNSRTGFEKLTLQAEMVKARYALQSTVFGMEPTADYYKPLGEHLIGQGESVVLVAGTAISELLDGRWDKNDTKDAANVADLIAQGKCLFYDLPSMDLRELRSLLSLKRRLKKLVQGYKVRMRNHLVAQYFPEMDDYFTYVEGPHIVRNCLDPKKLASLEFQEFTRTVPSGNGKQRERLREIYAKALSSIGCAAHPSVAFEASTLLDGLKSLSLMIRHTDKRIALVCRRFPEYPFLLSIPGFGPDVSSKVLGAIGDPHRFENHRQVLKVAGLDLSSDRSGKRNDATPVISKRGKADLRYGLYQAAVVASTSNPHFIGYFTDRLKGREREKGITTKMRTKLAAKLLVIAWTLMKKKEVFDPDCMK